MAMESTGVYWICLFQVLEDRGLEVCLVNARHVTHMQKATRTKESANCPAAEPGLAIVDAICQGNAMRSHSSSFVTSALYLDGVVELYGRRHR